MSKCFKIANNGSWSLAIQKDSEGVHIGTKPHHMEDYLGLYLSDEEQDELIFRLLQLRRKRSVAYA